MSIIVRIIINAAALWVAITVLDGIRLAGDSPLALLGIALVLGVVNVTIKPLMQVLSLPLIIVTLGLFIVIVNAVALWIAIALSGVIGFGITSDGFGWTLAAAVIVSLVSWGLEMLTGRR
ncbi:MAG: phage holin family protein [Nitriliruptoraceae bacterium]